MKRVLLLVPVLIPLFALFLSPAVAAQQQPLATAASNVPGLELHLMNVERKNNILTVKWAVVNSSDGRQPYAVMLTGKQVSTYVLDEENGVKYYVLTDQEGHSVASEHTYVGSDTYGISETLEPKQTYRYWMKLPAPPPEVKAVSLFFTQAEPIEGIAITDK
jgi:hypothetical protein